VPPSATDGLDGRPPAPRTDRFGARRTELADALAASLPPLSVCAACEQPIPVGASVLLPVCLHALCQPCAEKELRERAAARCARCGLDDAGLHADTAAAATAAAAAAPQLAPHPLVEYPAGGTAGDPARPRRRCAECPTEADGLDAEADEDTVATVVCTVCGTVFCDAHGALHRRFGPSKGHALAPLPNAVGGAALGTGSASASVSPAVQSPVLGTLARGDGGAAAGAAAPVAVCLVHGRPLEIYCTECRQAACVACLTSAHAKHDVALLAGALLTTQRSSMALAVAAATRAADESLDLALDAEDQAAASRSQGDATAAQVREAFAVLRQVLDEREAELAVSLRADVDAEVARFEGAAAAAKRHWVALAAALDIAKQLRAEAAPQPAAVVQLAPLVTARLLQLASPAAHPPPPAPPDVPVLALDPTVEQAIRAAGTLLRSQAAAPPPYQA